MVVIGEIAESFHWRTSVQWVSAITALAAVSFSRSGIGGEPATAMPFARRLLRARPLFAVLALCAAANGMTGKGIQPLLVKGKLEVGDTAPAFTEWNTFARISVGPT
jgi:hypothetical protein